MWQSANIMRSCTLFWRTLALLRITAPKVLDSDGRRLVRHLSRRRKQALKYCIIVRVYHMVHVNYTISIVH